ncbi:MAG: septal ring lytic transglycosylase RlpA family protein [Janthinobacterium lividum]
MSDLRPCTSSHKVLLTVALAFLAGCHHQTKTAYVPPPPAYSRGTGSTVGRNTTPELPPSASSVDLVPGFFDDTTRPPVVTETGLATWYYARVRAGSDGVKYGLAAPTAAHKTLPLGSTVRVTNLQTGQSTYVRITDRGPFVPGRILDLSEVAAKQIGIYRPGVVQVRVEAFAHPGADPVGRWCVQTGPFHAEGDAIDLKSALSERYRGARVAEFLGSTGYWIRIDPADRSRTEATQIAGWIGAPDAQTNSFLVRVN